MGDCVIDLYHVGGHTPSTIMVFIPQDKVVFLGDNYTAEAFPYTGDARYGACIEALRRLEQMNVDIVVPGHGDVCGKEHVRELKLYFEDMSEQVRVLRRAGLTKAEIIDRARVKAVDVSNWSSIPGTTAADQISADIGRMYDQVDKGLL